MPDTLVRIGAFSRRVGVSVELLRAWERRYGLPRPSRTGHGVRLYGEADERLVRSMRRALAQGIPAAEAARLAAEGEADAGASQPDGAGELGALHNRLRDALADLDDACAQEVLDRLFGAYSVDTALSEVILPYLADLGERWASDEIGVGEEHFASNLILGKLLSLARKWDEGHGPRALLACPPGEQHTIGLLSFGLALRGRGWLITYLGADTPYSAIAQVADAVRPAQVVLSSVRGETFAGNDGALAELAGRMPVALAGVGAAAGAVDGVAVFGGDPVSEAARLG
jgi:MerR family transcriptional regulator, light-induced transcriptional regulator